MVAKKAIQPTNLKELKTHAHRAHMVFVANIPIYGKLQKKEQDSKEVNTHTRLTNSSVSVSFLTYESML